MYYKRMHRKREFSELEADAQQNPLEIWSALKRLNNSPQSKTALEIVRDDLSVTADTKEVIDKQFHDISGLYSVLSLISHNER